MAFPTWSAFWAAAIAALATVAYLLLRRRVRFVLPRDLPASDRAANRRIPFRGARNTRDLGGYETAGGLAIKWGVLYRSGSLRRLTRRDREHFGDLALAKLIDLRSVLEREEEPHLLPPLSGVEIVHIPIEDVNFGSNGALREIIISGDISAIYPDDLMQTSYRQFVTRHTPCYRRFFAELLDSAGEPLMFNCSAGKDRTGLAAALLLRILGIPHDTVIKDYLLTGRSAAEERKWQIAFVRLTRGRKAEEVVRRLLSVQPIYLESAFAAIEQEYATFENYVAEGLALDADDVEQLRHYYLSNKLTTSSRSR